MTGCSVTVPPPAPIPIQPHSKHTTWGVLPRLIATLVNQRRQVKSLMKDKTAIQQKLLQVRFILTPLGSVWHLMSFPLNV